MSNEIQWYKAVVAGNADELFPHDKGEFDVRYRFRGKFAFKDCRPIARLERGVTGQVYLFQCGPLYLTTGEYETITSESGFAYQRDITVPSFHLDDIGRRTRHLDEEFVDGEAFIQLANRQLISDTHWGLRQRVKTTTADQYINHQTLSGYQLEEMQRLVGKYNLFRREFCPGGTHPFINYNPVRELREAIDFKVAKYNHPTAVLKRERARAKKLLNAALGHS